MRRGLPQIKSTRSANDSIDRLASLSHRIHQVPIASQLTRHMTNRLAQSHSPYLLQHQHNPVDWYPWGEEAFEQAKRRDVPIFLSVGYAACHWCHVMERESFEDDEIASIMNGSFVCVKVDREERPDVDHLYMTAVQSMTGHGGWPMSVFMTADARPFFGGTYWPPRARMGMPGFIDVLQGVARAWQRDRHQIEQQAFALTDHIQQVVAPAASSEDLGRLGLPTLESAVTRLERFFDPQHGGFGDAPKFPHCMDIEFLLRLHARRPEPRMATLIHTTLDRMACGGIFDHLGGGFARYSVDAQWLVPHFEKMLYDNGLLAGNYLRAAVAFDRHDYRHVARQTLDYVAQSLRDESGGFHSSEDADSEGEEGKFYVWSANEIDAILGADRGPAFRRAYGVTEAGNFEGHNILNRRHLPRYAADGSLAENEERQLATDRTKLLADRNTRVRPGRDDKVLVSWNALAIDSLALGSRVLDEPSFQQAAIDAAQCILTHLINADGKLRHAYRRGMAHIDAFLDDYAYLIKALLQLCQTTGQQRWLTDATRLADAMIERFADAQEGGFFFTASDGPSLIARAKDWHDHSVPSGNAIAIESLWVLGQLTGNQGYLDRAHSSLMAAREVIAKRAGAAAALLNALDEQLGPCEQWVLVGGRIEEQTAFVDRYFQTYRPRTVLAWGEVRGVPADREAIGGAITLYRCKHFACDRPVVGMADVMAALNSN
jgi:uncharacterized protein